MSNQQFEEIFSTEQGVDVTVITLFQTIDGRDWCDVTVRVNPPSGFEGQGMLAVEMSRREKTP